jgi:hypothetical protein
VAVALTRFISCCGEPIGGGGIPGADLADAAIRDDREKIATLGTTEDVLGNWSIDFDLLDPNIVNLVVTFSAFTKQSAGTGTYKVRVGGTYNTNDGTLWATLGPTAHTAYQNTPDTVTGAVFARPVGVQLVKLTGARSAAGGTASIQGIEIVFREP